MSLVEVTILRGREGLRTSYKAGSRAFLPIAKAKMAEEAGWVKIIGEASEAKPSPAKMVEPTPIKAAGTLATIDAVLARFGDDTEAMKAFAEEEGIYIPGRSKKPETVAKYIAEHYENA